MERQARHSKQTTANRLPDAGFTLIELLVVISIIAFLVAILVPCLGAARSRAGAVSCQARLRQWGMAFKMYTDENRGRWMQSSDWLKATIPFWSTTSKDIVYRDSSTQQVSIPKRCITLCPMTGLDKPPPFNATIFSVTVGFNSSIIKYDFAVSYQFNTWLSNRRGNFEIDDRLRPGGPSSWKTCNAKGVANIPVLFDGPHSECYPFHTDKPPGSAGFGPTMTPCINRHNGGINMLFMDWSVRKVGLKELWTLKWHRDFDTAGPWTLAGGVRPEDWPDWMRRFKDY